MRAALTGCSQFPAQLALLALGDSGHWVLLSPHLCPLECRASCRVCVTVHWDLTQLLTACRYLCCLEGLQVSVPPPLSCGEQRGSAVPASEHSPGVIVSVIVFTQHSSVLGFGVLMDVFLRKGGCLE